MWFWAYLQTDKKHSDFLFTMWQKLSFFVYFAQFQSKTF